MQSLSFEKNTAYIPKKHILEEFQARGMLDSRGNMKISGISDVEKLRTKLPICKVCDKHMVVFLSIRAYKLHMKEEHAY